MKLIPCPACRQLCPPETERCECGFAVRTFVARRNKQVALMVVALVVFFLFMLGDMIYWAAQM